MRRATQSDELMQKRRIRTGLLDRMTEITRLRAEARKEKFSIQRLLPATKRKALKNSL